VRGKCATVQTVLMRQVGGKEVQTETWDYKGSITMEVGVESGSGSGSRSRSRSGSRSGSGSGGLRSDMRGFN
jgi:hypothetical protein